MNRNDRIRKLQALADRTPYPAERESCLAKIAELRMSEPELDDVEVIERSTQSIEDLTDVMSHFGVHFNFTASGGSTNSNAQTQWVHIRFG